MTEDQRNFFLQRYRGMTTEELIELRAGDLTEVATGAINDVIAERGVSPEQQRNTTDQITEEKLTASEPYGVRGWLALLVIGMMILGPLMGAGRINSDIMMAEHQYPEITSLSQWKTYKTVTWWGYLIVVAISFYGGFGLVRGREWSVVTRAKQILWITGPVASIVMAVLIPLFAFGKMDVGPEFIGVFIGSLISAGIWTAYLSKSKRVRNTYGSSLSQQ